MVYNEKEYITIFESPIKKQQELAVARKIMDLLNKNKYDNLEEFIKKNSNYQDFLKNNNMQTVMKHFGNTLLEEDYNKILENLRKLTIIKQDYERDNIKTSNIDGKQYVTFDGEYKTYFVDNSGSNKPIEDQMKALQGNQDSLQTGNIKKNTENIFKELEEKLGTLNLQYLNEINTDSLNEEERQLYDVAYNYSLEHRIIIRIDLSKSVMVDEDNNIMRITKENGQIKIQKEENGMETEETIEKENEGLQYQLKPSPNTIYSN